MSFDDIKKGILWKMHNLDKSHKKSIDEKIRKLCEIINEKNNYVTTSSCSGRISVTKHKETKSPNAWIFKSHDKISVKDLLNLELPEDLCLLKMESAILHVACDSIDSAKKLLNIARECGFKRSGIISIKPNKKVIEILSTESLAVPFSKDGTLLVSKEYLELCVDLANKKLERTHEKIKKLEEAVKTI